MDIGAGLPWVAVLALLGHSAWMHGKFGDVAKRQEGFKTRVEALEKAITALSEELRAMNDKLESDFQMVTLCLIQLSNGNKITPADLKRKH